MLMLPGFQGKSNARSVSTEREALGQHVNTSRRMVAVNDHGNTIGEDHSKAILTDAEVRLMRELREADTIFWSYRRLAEKFEISKKHAWRICQMHQRAQIVDRWVRR